MATSISTEYSTKKMLRKKLSFKAASGATPLGSITTRVDDAMLYMLRTVTPTGSTPATAGLVVTMKACTSGGTVLGTDILQNAMASCGTGLVKNSVDFKGPVPLMGWYKLTTAGNTALGASLDLYMEIVRS